MKPILFNSEMVRAILEGRKVVTRRVINRDIVNNCDMETDGTLLNYENEDGDFINPVDLCRYRIGEILYVRETVWQKIGHYLDVDGESKGSFYNEFRYVATDVKPEVGWNYSWVKRPSIHMPKEAARLFLHVTNVRVERLQDITEDEIEKEGIEPRFNVKDQFSGDIAKGRFLELWDSTIQKSDLKKYGWEANPYVCVIEFERCEKPVLGNK